MEKKVNNHYTWLENNLQQFLLNLNTYLKTEIKPFIKDYDVNNCDGLIGAHGDKCYSSKTNEIPFEHLVAIYLLTYIYPFSNETREVWINHSLDLKIWVDPFDWVKANYKEGYSFINYLPKAYSHE